MNNLTPHAVLQHTAQHVHIAFDSPHQVLSSAVLNGGLTAASHILNLRVPKHSAPVEAPAQSLARYCSERGWRGTAVGMMTAASMNSLRVAVETVQGIDVAVLVTAGLSNARRVGDRAEYRSMGTPPEEIGTINIVALTSARLTAAAQVEALQIVTEAKAAALQEAGVRSPLSGLIATGTGTDATAIASGHGAVTVMYCGKHVLFGEVLGRLTMQALAASLQCCQKPTAE